MFESRKRMDIDANILYCWEMSQGWPYKDVRFNASTELKAFLTFKDDAQFGFCVQLDMRYADETKRKTMNFQLSPQNGQVDG